MFSGRERLQYRFSVQCVPSVNILLVTFPLTTVDESMPDDHINRTEKVLDVLAEATSLDVVSDFLRKKNLRHSAGSWKDMREKRLLPYLADFSITLEELVDLIGSSEECGDQHVFLYHCRPVDAVDMMDRTRVHAALRARKLGHLIDSRDMERTPESPTIVEVRYETAKVDVAMVIKVAEVRTRRRLERTKSIFGKFVKIYSDERVRAVNVAKLHRAGFLELRIQSRDNTTKYEGDLNQFIRLINQFFPMTKFVEMSLGKVKDVLWARREELKDLIRYTDAAVIDEHGNQVKAVTGSGKSDLSQGAVGKSVDFVLQADKNAYCAESNLWFNKSDHLSSEIHVLLNGAPNEFAITKKCSEADYGYVLDQIRHFNR
jgi:hypothetical protein